MTCPLWPPISLLQTQGHILTPFHRRGKVKFTKLFKPRKAALRLRRCRIFHPPRIQNHTSAEQGLTVTTTSATIRLSPKDTRDTDAEESNSFRQSSLLRLTSPGSKSQPPSLTWTKKACFPALNPSPPPAPSPPSPGVLLVLETDERPCVSWPFRCGGENKEEPQICLFFF